MRLEERWDFASFHVVISCFILSLFPSLGIYGGVKNCSDYHKLLSFINGKMHHVRKFFHWKAANMIVTDAKKRIIFQKNQETVQFRFEPFTQTSLLLIIIIYRFLNVADRSRVNDKRKGHY